jgi:hypothetical protein
MPGFAIRHNPCWKARLTIFLALIVPLYVLPCALRAIALGPEGWVIGVLISDLAGSIAVGFLTNNYRFGLLLYLGSTVFELVLLAVGLNRTAVIWAGDLTPALTAIYFAQQLYINMGD